MASAQYGELHFEGVLAKLLDTPEVQRLRGISQNGLAKTVYPEAEHSRFTHVTGVSHMAGVMAERLGLSAKEKQLIRVAGLLHDLGHPPFGHVLEELMRWKGKAIRHDEVGAGVIRGTIVIDLPGAGRIPKILRKHRINPDHIALIVTGDFGPRYPKKRYLQQIIDSEVDADKLDYLRRDAERAGIELGKIDYTFILSTLVRHGGEIAVLKKGAESVVDMLGRRRLMFRSVYTHKTVRIAEMMMLKTVELGRKAVEQVVGGPFWQLTESEMETRLIDLGGVPQKLSHLIKFRKLYKIAFELESEKLFRTKKGTAFLNKLKRIGRHALEKELLQQTGLQEGALIVDFPAKGIGYAGSKLKTCPLKVVFENGRSQRLYTYSKELQDKSRLSITPIAFAVYASKKHRAAVARAAQRLMKRLQ